MAPLLPQGTDKLNSPSHSFMHRVINVDSSSPESSITVDADGKTTIKIKARVTTTTDDATAVIDTDSYDVYELSAIANATTFSLTGTPTDKQSILIVFKDAGVSKGLTWTGFTPIGITLPTATTAGKWHYVGAKYNNVASQWHALVAIVEA